MVSNEGGGFHDLRFAALEQELRCLAVLRKTEHQTASGEEESIGGGRCGGQDDGIDDRWESWDTGASDGNNPWGCRGAVFAGADGTQQVGVVIRNQHADKERTKNVEDENTPEDTTASLGNVDARVLGLTTSNGDGLDTSVRKSGVDERGEPTQEATFRSICHERLHRTRVIPVAEADAVARRTSTEDEDEGQDEEAGDGDQLDTGEDELGLSVDGDGKDVQGEDEDDDDGDPCRDLFIYVS